MKYLSVALMIIIMSVCPGWAWDGFDADSADLVEIIPDAVPSPGSTIDVRSYDTDQTSICLVESVTRNQRTIEVVVRDANGARRTLVMEGR